MITADTIAENLGAANKAPASEFLRLCCSIGRDTRDVVASEDLGIGLGVETGNVRNVLILGRWDYVGGVVNRAAKYQANMRDCVRFSQAVLNRLRSEEDPWFRQLEPRLKKSALKGFRNLWTLKF